MSAVGLFHTWNSEDRFSRSLVAKQSSICNKNSSSLKRNNFEIIGDFYSQIRRPLFSKSLFSVLISHLNDFLVADRSRDQSYRCLNEGDRRAFAQAMAAFTGSC